MLTRLMDYGLSAIKHLPNKERKSEDIGSKLKKYVDIVDEELAIIEKVTTDGTMVQNKNNKKSIVKAKKSPLYYRRGSTYYSKIITF